MAEKKTPDAKVATDANAELQQKRDAELAQGYVGTVPDEHPNDAYSLQTGPDSPPLVTDDRTRFNQPPAPPGPGGKEG